MSRHVLLCSLLLLAGLPATAQDFDRTEITERTFKVEPGQTLTIDADLGRVILVGKDTDEVYVRVIEGTNNMSRDRSEDLFERHEVSFRETQGGLEVYGDYDGNQSWRRGRRLHVVYEVALPHDLYADVKTSGGSVHAEAIDGDVTLRTSGGSVRAMEIGGILEVRTSGGSIEVKEARDKVDLRTSGGSISLTDVAGDARCRTSGGTISADNVRGVMEARTSGGSIRLTEMYGSVDAQTSGGSIAAEMMEQPDEDMTLRTSGGSVTLTMSEDVRARIDAQASGGRVRSDLPITVRGEIKRSHLRGTMNGGGPLLTLRSSGGNVNLRAH
ncbi:MAG: DUF4097 family beta strand repeat-containing protein [Bacteroidota bacterium]